MFQVLHSSAGTGKTHALVKYYLEHCLKGDDHGAYRQVLALTFTNKAASEMKERVIGYLEKLAHGGPHAGPLLDLEDHLVRSAKVDRSVLATRAEAVLGHMLHHWSDVAISTIDAFTHRVVRPFARDLRLDHDVRMTTEQAYYRNAAVDSLIDAAGTDERITSILTRTCLQLLHEERSWDPAKPLRDLSYELLKESSIGPLERLRAFDLEGLAPLMDRLNTSNAQFRKRVSDIGKEAQALFGRHGLSEVDLAYGKGGIHGYFRKLSAFSDSWEPPGPQTMKPLETGKWHSGKASPEAIAALETLSDRLTLLFAEAETIRANDLRDHLIRRSIVRELLPTFALHELDVKLEALKKADRVAFFSDLTRRVAEVVKDEPVPFIYERMGERYRHFLIDEFQDTSLMQWKSLLPLIENALSSGGTTLLVGDAKQAIYRWRNGEVRLFVELPKVFGRDPTDSVEEQREKTLERNFSPGDRLDQNRRSAQHIIQFNNELFGALAQQLPPDLRKVYKDHDQRTAHADLGVVTVVPADAKLKGDALKEAILGHALDRLEEALAAGFAPGDVAILVRSKRTGRAIAGHFLQHGHSVVSPDGLQLGADPAIQLLIELLRFLHDGEASTAARVLQWQAMVFASQADPALGTGLPTTPLFAPRDRPFAPLHELRSWLEEHGEPRLRTTIAALIAELAHAHALHPAEDAAVLTLLDEAHSWSSKHAQDIGGFLAHWERSGGERSTASPEHGQAVQIMTVHKSKGLQFPVVIVPDARMVSSTAHGELFWIAPGMAVPELDVALVRENKQSRGADLPELIEEDGLRTLDALNLLYVAFTRAEQRLYAFVPHATDAITKSLLEFLSTRPPPAVQPAEGPRKARVLQPARPMKDVSGGNALPELTMRFEAPLDWDPADPDPHRAFGTAVHAALEATRTAADLPRALAQAVHLGDLTHDQAERLQHNLGPIIASPALAPWFASQLDVRAEATLITADGRSLRPDRLVIDGDRIRVLEIKTGKPSDAHADQVRSYFTLLRELGHHHVEGAVWYLASGHIEPVDP